MSAVTNNTKTIYPIKSNEQLKEEIWGQFPKEIRDAIGKDRLKDTELLTREYSKENNVDSLMHQFWHLEKDDFKKLAIGKVGNDPFFAYHVFCPEDSNRYTVTIHHMDSVLDGTDEWVINAWHWEQNRLSSTENVASSKEEGAPAIFKPRRLDSTTEVFNGNNQDYKLMLI